jgi:hypothetical protein
MLISVTYYANSYHTEMHKGGQRCTELIEKTADALGDGVLCLIFMAVQKYNLEQNINQAIKW